MSCKKVNIDKDYVKTTTKYNKRNGELIIYYENGNIHNKYYYIDDIKNGEYIEYYENGNINGKYYYIDDERNGEQIIYHKNGNIERKYYYIDDYEI